MKPTDKELEEMNREFVRGSRIEAGVALMFGVLMLGLGYYLAGDDVPLLRQGRLLLVWGMGGVAVAYGVSKLLNPTFME